MSLAKTPSTAFSHRSQRDRSGDKGTQAKGMRGEEDVGVKRKVQRGWRSSCGLDLRMLVGCAVVQERVDQLSGGHIPLSGFGPRSTIRLDYTVSQPWRPS